ncbi:TIR domain-containing protein [Rhizobium leguminosarum]|uniref:toll/interleukin-1 receptor domain-containing protein n=1 Tax=Rhizobium leguminosarum TaxID=384 RepID=UPI001C98611C|nr:toll/interleukin-1 receptor domain-containing protein [Rhizobium leguminosarum]MBY5533630.1 TIR domain-containing protein [Rhizobium leguminosarum]
MKVFISHKSDDSALAADLGHRLKASHGIEFYLDLIDRELEKNGEDLASHLRTQLGKCTQLLAVISDKTKSSWWVPWEIGVATEKNYPLATYAGGNALPPEYLRKWPYLRSLSDLDLYAAASKIAAPTATRRSMNEETARVQSTQQFYSILRRSLGQ